MSKRPGPPYTSGRLGGHNLPIPATPLYTSVTPGPSVCSHTPLRASPASMSFNHRGRNLSTSARQKHSPANVEVCTLEELSEAYKWLEEFVTWDDVRTRRHLKKTKEDRLKDLALRVKNALHNKNPSGISSFEVHSCKKLLTGALKARDRRLIRSDHIEKRRKAIQRVSLRVFPACMQFALLSFFSRMAKNVLCLPELSHAHDREYLVLA